MKLCYSGYSLMRDPRYNKGLAFTDKERDAHYLTGLLPPVVLSQEVQVTFLWFIYKKKQCSENRSGYIWNNFS